MKTLEVAIKQYGYRVLVIILIVHLRKKQGLMGFDNDDLTGSSNITNLVDVNFVIPDQKERISADTIDREWVAFKNRLTGQTNRNGIKRLFQGD